MYTDSQRLGFKIGSVDQRYQRKVQQSLAESRQSFTGVQTPGWSSLMKSELSDNTKRVQNTDRSEPLKESDIMRKLTRLQNVKWEDVKLRNGMDSQKVDKNETLDTYKTRSKGKQSSKNKHLSKAHSASGLNQNSRCKQGQKRWNQITVHEHLHLLSRKLENKRMVEKLLDQEFKKKQIFKFQPTINPNSSRLAEIKFSRIQARQDLEKQEDSKNQNTNTNDTKDKESKEVERYRILNSTFYYLSQQTTLLTQQSIKKTLEQLPLPCIQTLQPIIQSLYQGSRLQWVDFVEQFNDKKIKQKESFFTLMEKWFTRRDKMFNE